MPHASAKEGKMRPYDRSVRVRAIQIGVLILSLFLSTQLAYAQPAAQGQMGGRWPITILAKADYTSYPFISLALDGANRPHAAYYTSSSLTAPILEYRYQDTTGWHVEVVDTDVVSGMMNNRTSLSLDTNGRPHVSYQGTGGGTGALIYAYRDAAGWHREVADNSDFLVGEGSSLTLDANDLPHISYYNQNQHDLKYAYRDSTGWHTQTIDADGDAGWSSSLAIDSLGYAHIAYLASNPDTHLMYAYQDAAGWHIATVDSDFVTGAPSLRLDAQGTPHISYAAASPDISLKYAYQDGMGWHTESLSFFASSYTSLALNHSGEPYIAFEGGNPTSLHYAYHDAWGWQIERVDQEDFVGSYCSLALDSKERPHILYGGNRSQDLRYTSWYPYFTALPVLKR
jgi:hypothetical protein